MVKRNLDHLAPVAQRWGWQLVLVPFVAAGVVLLHCLGGGVRPVVPAYGPAFELDACTAHVAGGDAEVADEGWPVPASFSDSVFHCVSPVFGGPVCRHFFGKPTGADEVYLVNGVRDFT